mmetsp:Transcript_43917/g.71413  ORF Transcript_43917/g.71413 Transcript_43917/m.71413 type:complete len:210 (+) Transcript_43917:1267-1896(+)
MVLSSLLDYTKNQADSLMTGRGIATVAAWRMVEGCAAAGMHTKTQEHCSAMAGKTGALPKVASQTWKGRGLWWGTGSYSHGKKTVLADLPSAAIAIAWGKKEAWRRRRDGQRIVRPCLTWTWVWTWGVGRSWRAVSTCFEMKGEELYCYRGGKAVGIGIGTGIGVACLFVNSWRPSSLIASTMVAVAVADFQQRTWRIGCLAEAMERWE